MTEADYLVLDTYVAETARTMGLADWRITVSREPPEGEALASCYWTNARKYATVRFDPAMRTYDSLKQRHMVAHELLHCTFGNPWDMVETDLKASELLSGPSHSIFYQVYERQMEYSIDSVADVLEQFLPPIPWPTEAPITEPA